MTPSDPPAATGGQPARHLPADAITIRCREHGPLVVEMPTGGAFQGLRLRVTDHEGREFSVPVGKQAVALCRCGQSGNRPFCDGSHKKCGFEAAERAPG